MSDKISAREAFDNATYKQAADKIRQILSAIRNNPASSAKRWVWELMQNAKDIPNKYGKVSVEIELISENELDTTGIHLVLKILLVLLDKSVRRTL